MDMLWSNMLLSEHYDRHDMYLNVLSFVEQNVLSCEHMCMKWTWCGWAGRTWWPEQKLKVLAIPPTTPFEPIYITQPLRTPPLPTPILGEEVGMVGVRDKKHVLHICKTTIYR